MEALELQFDRERLEGDKDYRDEFRFRCQTDGFFLAPLLDFHDFDESVHREVADLYVQKSPGVSIADQDPIKRRLHLDPRHTFKTTWGILDNIQWITIDPNVTIVNETATQPLGKALTLRTAKVFHCPKNRRPSLFQLAFPEYVIQKLHANYRAPCATRDEIEPTLYSTSVGSAQSGWHPWIINPDDMVDIENSGIKATDDSRQAVWDTYTTNDNTRRAGGYVHVRGTRYHPFDAYGRMLETMDETEWKTLIRASLVVKSGERLVEGEFPTEKEVDLTFPTMLPWKTLRTKFREDYRTFMCQQMNDPQGGGVSIFPAKLYKQMLIEEDRIPVTGELRACWRLQSDAKGYMKDYAEGAIARYSGAKVTILDAWGGAYTPTELCKRIVTGCKRNDCGELTIEKTPGSDDVIPHLYNEAMRQNWSLKIDRPEFQVDDADRIGRMKNLQPMAEAGRLWISTDCSKSEELKRQFTFFRMVESNGLVDVISRLALRMPISNFKGHVSSEQRAMHREAMEHGMFDMIYGQGGAVEVEKAIQEYREEKMPSRNQYGLRPMLGGLDGRY